MKAIAQRSTARPTAGGFTLIEIMIVMVVIGILASIAVPSYLQHVRKSFRSQAQSCMLQTAQAMERRYTTNLAYDKGDNTGDPALGCRTEGRLDTRYAITVGNIDARTYTITATPSGDQTNDICGTMTLDQQSTKTPTTAGCW